MAADDGRQDAGEDGADTGDQIVGILHPFGVGSTSHISCPADARRRRRRQAGSVFGSGHYFGWEQRKKVGAAVVVVMGEEDERAGGARDRGTRVTRNADGCGRRSVIGAAMAEKRFHAMSLEMETEIR